ncbi:MAG: hypothetical protein HY216_15665 [Candidatus Rokubacteria bacterium]|nr:hypothetical protein [Candidatus Rokubacteria bacterium]
MRSTVRAFVVLLGLVLASPPVVEAQQASLTLSGSAGTATLYNVTDWSLAKAGTLSGSMVDWTVTSTRGATGANTLAISGFVSVSNTGTANATIGNIVVNLQKPVAVKRGTNWVSAAANVAAATGGDAATTANIVASASQETGGPNYVLSGAKNVQGTFLETPGVSGSLEFTDADQNTVWAITPQQVLAPGQTVRLLFTATFNNTILMRPEGSLVRAEVIVTFGNAGARGGSGASATNIDINGNGYLDADEGNVRSVPTRLTLTVPSLTQVNNTVTLSDLPAALTTTGTVTFAGATTTIGGGAGVADVSASGTDGLSATVAGGSSGGSIANCANLDLQNLAAEVTIGTDPATLLPIVASLPLVTSQDLRSCATVPVPPDEVTPPPPPTVGPTFTTFTQGGWGAKPNGGNPAARLAASFAAVYGTTGVEIGIAGSTGFSMKFTAAAAIEAYLPAGGPAAMLTKDLVNPTESASGVLGGQVLALKLNVDFSAAGLTLSTGGSLGALVVCGTGTPLDGTTVAAVLGAANTALGGGALPAGMTYSTLNDLVTEINESWDNGAAGAFAPHLSTIACQ